jgi:uncharacterized protein YgbK (DUF1537 family)
MRSMILGCIADDLTGATDLALMLAREGLRTVQTNGIPAAQHDLSGADAVVVALRSRSIPAADAVALSLQALEALRQQGARRFLFKYCSTFDSTDEGNIGPVSAALMAALGTAFTIACPAFPATGRSIYMGNLFVNGVPLDESSMKDHPLNPMHDADLRRVLQRQTKLKVGGIDFRDVDPGAAAIAAAAQRESAAGTAIAIVDALTDRHLREIGAALADLPLITGGSGIAMGLPQAYLRAGLIAALTPPAARLPAPAGRALILAGSCSAATRGQIAAARQAGYAMLKVEPEDIAAGKTTASGVLDWIRAQSSGTPPLVYSSDDPEAVKRSQEKLGRERAGHLVEKLLAELAPLCVGEGFTRLLIAGGETSGAVVQGLGIDALAIGPEIDPGVPWTRSLSQPDVVLALKSGNFGTPDFFIKAWDRLS